MKLSWSLDLPYVKHLLSAQCFKSKSSKKNRKQQYYDLPAQCLKSELSATSPVISSANVRTVQFAVE